MIAVGFVLVALVWMLAWVFRHDLPKGIRALLGLMALIGMLLLIFGVGMLLWRHASIVGTGTTECSGTSTAVPAAAPPLSTRI